MKKICLLVLLFTGYKIMAQESLPQAQKSSSDGKRINAIYAEFGGAGLIFTVNYDVRFTKSNMGPGLRIGAGGMAAGGFNFYAFPFQVNYLLGKRASAFEIGAGATLTNLSKSFAGGGGTTVLGTMSLMYRLQPIDGGVAFRVGITPFFGSEAGNFYFFPFFGASIGYCF